MLFRGEVSKHVLIREGFHKYSIGYQSNGHRRYNQPFSSLPYGPQLVQGDVIGVGYRPRTGAIFYTRNGKRLEEVVHGLKAPNFFPSIGANGPAIVHVNFGQAGFVFIEANVKKWGLAPVTGSLAPPPPYGSEAGSILLETGTKDGYPGSQARGHSQSISGSPYAVRNSSNLNPQHNRTRSGNFRVLPPTSPGPVRSSTDISLAHFVPADETGEASGSMPQAEHEHHNSNPLHLHLEDATNPPPDYTSPPHSEDDVSQRDSIHSDENSPLIRVRDRSRAASAAATIPVHPHTRGGPTQQSSNQTPIQGPAPSYSDALRQGAGQATTRSQSPLSISSRTSSSLSSVGGEW